MGSQPHYVFPRSPAYERKAGVFYRSRLFFVGAVMPNKQKKRLPVRPQSPPPIKVAPATTNGPSPPDKKLSAWLNEQATKLKHLDATGKKLKLDFVENARSKGTILLAVQERLREVSQSFEAWVPKNTDIGYSTALLWIDVAKHFDSVKKRFADSNPLELTVRQVRDAIRDARQEQGDGKPGSGRRKATTAIPLNLLRSPKAKARILIRSIRMK